MSTQRNSLVYLLEIYELLLEGPQTFNSLRTAIGIGYNSLRRLLDKLQEKELIYSREIDEITRYYPTEELFDLFTESFYKGLRELQHL